MVKTSEAAALLNVSPNTLRAWERRFGYPRPTRSPGKHRLYPHADLVALREALQEGLTISSAISRARERVTAERWRLQEALLRYDTEAADAVMYEGLALTTVEHVVEQQLLPALDAIAAERDVSSAAWGFAGTWAVEWLGRARRLSPVDHAGPRALLIVGDAHGLVPMTVHAHALHLLLTREGVRVLALPSSTTRDATDLIQQFQPMLFALAGPVALDDERRWRDLLRRTVVGAPLLVFRDEAAETGRELDRLPGKATTAARVIADIFTRPVTWPSGTVAPVAERESA
jgi:DNA-binding transcriptional MerR regulator